MKKLLPLLLVAVLFFSPGSISVFAADEVGISVETPVRMTLVSETDGNYEYRVSASVVVTRNSVAASGREVSILMFGNKDNSAFVSGDNVLSLTAEEIAADYFVYYVNQDTSDAQGKVTFEFNVVLPSPAKTDAYYVWVGAEGLDAPDKLDSGDLSISSQVVAVTLTADSSSVTAGEGVALTPDAVNIFGNTVPGTEFDYTVTQDDARAEASIVNNILYTYSLSGIYNIMVTATAADGTQVTSDPITLSVDGTILLGDTDGNKRINLGDVLAVLKHIAEIATLEGDALTASDVDKNQSVDIQDAHKILKYIARIITQF